MYNTQCIADRIKNILKAQKKSSKEMLTALDMGINTISEFAKGRKLSCVSLARIADYLDCSVDYLLGRTDILEKSLTSSDMIFTSSHRENVLLINFRNMNIEGQEYILQTVDMAKDKYDKYDSVSKRKSI